jgi:hypothetical protein
VIPGTESTWPEGTATALVAARARAATVNFIAG